MQEHDHTDAGRVGDAEYGKGELNRGFFPERRSFDLFLVPFSKRCLNAPPDQLDREIEQCLSETNSFFSGDRILLWEILGDGQRACLTHSYVEAGTEPPAQTFLHETLPYIFGSLCSQKNLCVSRLEDLPQEADIDLQYLEFSGIRSFMVIPLMVSGTLQGALSLACTRTEREWSHEDLLRFQRVGEVLSALIDRSKWHHMLEQRIEFETLITDVSARLIKASMGEVDAEIENTLALIRDFFQVDRCVLCGVRSNRKFVWVTHGSYGEGLEPVSGDINLADLFPWTYERIVIQGKHINVTSIEELSLDYEMERKSWSTMGIRSALSLPLFLAGQVSFIIVLNTLHEERIWPEKYVPRLRLLGEIIINALERRNNDTALRQNEIELQEQLREIKQLKLKIEMENFYLRDEVALLYEHSGIIAVSRIMKSVLQQLEQVARTDSTVLISGETGTGKELLAREIHTLSSRKERTLVVVNCASLSPTLIESELFGREKGAYTGAMTRMAGRFEVADGSTLFLDEIAELPLELQSKLLRVIEQGSFERLGSTRTIHVNVRIIAATNRDLEQEVKRGAFRQDLFYRLNVFPLTMPSLRERKEDIPSLIWAFVRHFEKKMGKRIEKIPGQSMEALQSWSWPGNVRELRNIIEHAMIITRGKNLEVVMPKIHVDEHAEKHNIALETAERKHILSALQKCGWRISGPGGAAEALGLKRTTLQSKMKKLGIERPTY